MVRAVISKVEAWLLQKAQLDLRLGVALITDGEKTKSMAGCLLG